MLRNKIDPTISGVLISTYATSRLKALIIVIGAILFAFSLHALLEPYFTHKEHLKYIFMGCSLIAIIPVVQWGGYIFRKFSIRSYENGINIWRYGFFKWDEIQIASSYKILVLIFPANEPAKKYLPTEVFYSVNLTHMNIQDMPSLYGHYFLRIHIPQFLMNKPQRQFLQEISSKKVTSQQTVSHSQPRLTDAKKRDRQALFFGPNATPIKAISILLCILMLSGLYLMIAGEFIVLKSSIEPFINIICALLTAYALFYVLKNRATNPALAEASKTKIFFHMIAAAFICPLLIYTIFIMPILVPYHYLTGHKYAAVIYYEGKDRFDTQKQCNYKHALETKALDMPMLKSICLNDDFYDHMPQDGFIIAKGIESAIGRSVRQVALPPERLNPLIKSALRAKVHDQWVEYR